MEALGMVEVIGYSSAVMVLDQMLKTSNIKFLNLEKVKGGLVTLFVEGQVADVKTAVDTGKELAKSINSYVSSSVIARASQGIENLVAKKDVSNKNLAPKIMETTEDNTNLTELDTKVEVEEIAEGKKYDIKQLEKTTVGNLRTMLRKEKLPEVQSSKIKFMDKASLVKYLSNIAN